jgi:MinD-like ATPase involved in chromosome partitioning or flagellar assembly
MPSLLEAGGVSPAAGELWGLAVMGRQPLSPERTLAESEVLDGAVLVLRRDTPELRDRVSPAASPARAEGSPLERSRRRLTGAGALEAVIRDARPVRCATIAVVSPKGGVGKTTVSVLLGELLATLRTDTVLALDADGDYGSLTRIGPAAPAAGDPVRDDEIFPDLSQGAVTFAELDRRLWRLHHGLRIVPAPRDPAAMARTDRAVYARVIGNLQRLAAVLILDCGTGLAQAGAQAAIIACDQLLIVSDASGASISLAHEAATLLERAGRPITIVGNRLARGRGGAEELARLDASFPSASALAMIPEDPAAQLALRGEFDFDRAPRPVHDAILELAGGLVAAWPEVGLTPDGRGRSPQV